MNQFEDARLSSRYNLMAFDMRCAGRSSSRPSGAHDTWVDAADLAFALIVRTPFVFSFTVWLIIVWFGVRAPNRLLVSLPCTFLQLRIFQ